MKQWTDDDAFCVSIVEDLLCVSVRLMILQEGTHHHLVDGLHYHLLHSVLGR